MHSTEIRPKNKRDFSRLQTPAIIFLTNRNATSRRNKAINGAIRGRSAVRSLERILQKSRYKWFFYITQMGNMRKSTEGNFRDGPRATSEMELKSKQSSRRPRTMWCDQSKRIQKRSNKEKYSVCPRGNG
jgi:hypothetical protein